MLITKRLHINTVWGETLVLGLSLQVYMESEASWKFVPCRGLRDEVACAHLVQGSFRFLLWELQVLTRMFSSVLFFSAILGTGQGFLLPSKIRNTLY